MPYDDPDATDPMTLHAIEVETDSADSIREMAACFVEEYVRLGISAERIYEMFTDGSFAGPALAHRRLGGEIIAGLIAEQFAIRGPNAMRLAVERAASGSLHLPILELKENAFESSPSSNAAGRVPPRENEGNHE